MRPYQGRLLRSLRFSVSCIQDKDLIYIAIFIPIVIRVINQRISLGDCFAYHFGRMHIAPAYLIGIHTIISIFFIYGNRSNHIKGEIELAIALRIKVIVHRTTHTKMGISYLIKEILIFRERICHLSVWEVNQYHKSLPCSDYRILVIIRIRYPYLTTTASLVQSLVP